MKLCSSPYQEYGVSDNEWYEYLPSTWSEKRVKNIFRLITDIAPNNNDFELLSLYASIGVRPRKDMEQRGNKAVTTDGYWIVRKGDIIVNKLLAWMGAIGLSEYDGVTSPAYDILRKLNQNVDAKFYTYLFRTEKAQAIFKKHSRGIMDVRFRLYFDKFGAITVPFPPISEQEVIAYYLDTKTAQIDRKIDLLTQKATLYGDLKQSLINETVTRGLDKTVPMKDSGVEWLGEVPEHWEIRRIKEIAYINKISLTDKTPSDYEFDYIDIGSVTYGRRGFSSEHMTFENAPSRARRIVKKGDTIISTVRTYLKAITSIEDDVSNLIVSTGFAVISPRKVLLSKYFSYQSISNFFIDKICALSTGVSYPATNSSAIADLLCLIPPASEQTVIADFLDTKTAQLDQIIQTINTQIEKLKELRKTLINDVVIGKIKVV